MATQVIGGGDVGISARIIVNRYDHGREVVCEHFSVGRCSPKLKVTQSEVVR
jgi:hypothetical protein